MTRISRSETNEIREHAREVAANRSHLANSGVATDECLSLSRDFDGDGRLNARGKTKLAIWEKEFQVAAQQRQPSAI